MRAKAIIVAALLLGTAAGAALGYLAKARPAACEPAQQPQQSESPKSRIDRKQIPQLVMTVVGPQDKRNSARERALS
jgi:hypothetical protein